MDPKLVAILATVALSVLALALTLWGRQRGRGARHLVAGIGWTLLPIGLWITGVMDLLVNGLRSVASWLNRTVMDTQHWIGVVVAGLGVVLVLASLAIAPRTKEQALAARTARRAPVTSSAATTPGTKAVANRPATAAPATQDKAASKALSDEDAEIEAILKSRGIN